MRVIKGKNQYAIVLSKDELRYITACVGMGIHNKVIERIRAYPLQYGAGSISSVDSGELFSGLKEHIPNKVDS